MEATPSQQFLALVNTETPRFIASANRILQDEESAKDAVQDALITAYQSLEKFENRSSLRTWVHRIIINTALARYRLQKRRNDIEEDAFGPDFDQHGIMLGSSTEPTVSAEHLMEQAQIRSLVRTTIESLPEAFRIVLVLRDIEELNTDETAKLLNCTPGALKVRLHRARFALKAALTPHIEGFQQ